MAFRKQALVLAAAVLAAITAFASGNRRVPAGCGVPVHRFVPVDADGESVSVRDHLPKAISQEKTCGQCHDVGAMKGGSHFRTGAEGEAENRVNREPWFLCGSNSCKVVSAADRGGMTGWEWTKMFGIAFPGGGVGDGDENADCGAGDRQRWFVSGKLEKNCLACHSQDPYDASEWAKQVLRENWSGAALAAAGYARVEGMNARLDPAWDPFVRENPDDHLFKVPENIVYDRTKFDDKGRCVFNVGRPKNENCLACHAVEPANANCEVTAFRGDVHLQRGMKCVDCHRNGADHRMRTLSCRECHMSDKGTGPKPVHEGIPLVHFEKLSCAVCHSGVTHGDKAEQVRTARANRIGIFGKADWATDCPRIEEPFFRQNAEGKVEICRRAEVPGTNGTEYAYWPIAHNVKPARMARGGDPEKCAACHSPKSGFFDDWDDKPYFSAFNLAFLGRPLFKVVLWTVFAGLCIFAAGAAGAAMMRLRRKKRENIWRKLFMALADIAFAVAAGYLAASGVAGFLRGGMTRWWLMAHMVAGGVMAGAAVAMAFMRSARRTRKAFPAAVWTVWLVLAAGTVFTAVMPMMSVFGSHGQLILLWAHRCTSLAFLAVSLLVCAMSVRKR